MATVSIATKVEFELDFYQCFRFI